MKKPFYKRWWFIALVIIFIIGTIGSDGEDAPESVVEKPVEQVSAEVKDEVRESQPVKTEELKEELDDATKVELMITMLEGNFEGMADIRYVEEYDAFMFDLKGDVANAVTLLVLQPDNQEVSTAWYGMVDNFKDMSKSVSDTMGTGYQFHVTNPGNRDNVLLSIMDGIVFYNFMDEM